MIQLSEAKITNLSLAYLELNYAYLEPKYHTTIGIQLVCYARSRMTTPFTVVTNIANKHLGMHRERRRPSSFVLFLVWHRLHLVI